MINVSCAIIKNDRGEILVTQRSASMKLPLKWEFPGGKIEENETAEECLLREIREELSVEIEVIKSLTSVEYYYDDFSIRLVPFICEIKDGNVKLTEHANFLWLKPIESSNLDWAEADIPVLENYILTEN